MFYSNRLEGEIASKEKELREAELNNWDFDIRCIKDELEELKNELRMQEEY